MLQALPIRQYAHGQLASTRITAMIIREEAEASLKKGWNVAFDFAEAQATQSFVDELIGNLVLKFGPDILDRITFKSCSPGVRNVIEFVVSDRSEQYISTHTH